MEKSPESKTIKRIALIGPESSGKTTLCMQLAAHYNTVWVPEYARTFMENLNRVYTYQDVIHCAFGQMKAEDALAEKACLPGKGNPANGRQANRFLFCDTELINYKIWFEDKFKKTPGWMESEITKRKYALYLLTTPDLPWVHEAVRENPERREYFFDLYKKELEKRKFSYGIISGAEKSRLEGAILHIDTRIAEPQRD